MSSKLVTIYGTANMASIDADSYHGGAVLGPCVQLTVTYHDGTCMWVGLDLDKTRSLWRALGEWIAKHGG